MREGAYPPEPAPESLLAFIYRLASCGPLIAPRQPAADAQDERPTIVPALPSDASTDTPVLSTSSQCPEPPCMPKRGGEPASLDDLIRGECACTLRPAALFVAWNGVIVLTYTGFPPPLVRLKRALNESATLGLPKENFGSKWPKTTLAATNDPLDPLSLDEFKALKALCNQHTAKIFEHSVRSTSVRATCLTVTKYNRRGLEAEGRIETRAVPLAAPIPEPEVPGFEEGPSSEERARVTSVLSEWDDEAAYLPRVVAEGARISTYREASPSGTTLVAFLDEGEAESAALAASLSAFRLAVNERFPGRFAWLRQESLHVTVRALS